MQDQDVTRAPEQPNTAVPQQGVPIPISRPIATHIILGLLVAIFIVQMGIDQTSENGSNWLLEFGVLWPYGVLHGDAYRLLTAMFLHANIAHIAFNGYALWIYGK